MADINLEGPRRAEAAGQMVYVHHLMDADGAQPAADLPHASEGDE